MLTEAAGKKLVELVKAKLANKADTTHTHKYAGSSTVGGAATSANKLATARTIALSGGATGSASFDGSANVTITATLSASAVFLAAHPVGCIYETTVATNPGSTYGGTWTMVSSMDGYRFRRTA